MKSDPLFEMMDELWDLAQGHHTEALGNTMGKFKTTFERVLDEHRKRVLLALEKIALMPTTIPPLSTVRLTVQPCFHDDNLMALRLRALYVDYEAARSIKVCDVKVGNNSALRSLEAIPGIAFVPGQEQVPNLPDDVPLLMQMMNLSMTLLNTTTNPVRVEPWVLFEHILDDVLPPNSFEIDVGNEPADPRFEKVMAMVAPVSANPCAGGCGKRARPGFELCASCAEAGS